MSGFMASGQTMALPFAVTLSLTLSLRLLNLILPSDDVGSNPAINAAAKFEGRQIAIKVWESGRYLEVGDDLWLYASSFTHNKPSTRFEVEPVSPDLLRHHGLLQDDTEYLGL